MTGAWHTHTHKNRQTNKQTKYAKSTNCPLTQPDLIILINKARLALVLCIAIPTLISF